MGAAILGTSKFGRKLMHNGNLSLLLSGYRSISVLGIETSCDDTGIAIVTGDGKVIANVLDSQQEFHTRYGGIVPPRAQDLHRIRITNIFERCLEQATIDPFQLDAIAITTRPGLPLSLQVGLRFAKYLGRKYNKPLVAVHHMEAHALQARMGATETISYPFICLLISGGHCQLAFVQSAYDFLLLGESLDDAPGEAFDKIARRLRLFLIPKYRLWNGGRAIEDAAQTAVNLNCFDFPLPLSQQRNCNFSFAGIKNNSFRAIKAQEKHERTPPDSVISNYNDFCASLLNATSRHLMVRTQRALEYSISRGLFGNMTPKLVVSGGVANNDIIFANITNLCEHYNCQTYRPEKRFCSDNGVMVAWNGIEQIRDNPAKCLRWNYESVNIRGKVKLGKSVVNDVVNANIKCKWVKPLRIPLQRQN